MAKPARRNKAKERYWRRLLVLWRRSGLTGREFCAEEGLSEPSFYAWRREIARRDQEAAGNAVAPPSNTPPSSTGGNYAEAAVPAFVKVTLADSTTMPPAIEVVVGQGGQGRVLRVRPGFDAELLRQLLRLLEEQPEEVAAC